ncbi:hypothetical protein EMIT0P74_130070 [Pseudomonas sp. IT-P74]
MVFQALSSVGCTFFASKLAPTVDLGLCRSEIRAQTKTPDLHRPGVFLSPENQD